MPHHPIRRCVLLMTGRCALFLAVVLLFGLLPIASQAQGTALVATKLRASRPGLLGRFATVEGTLKNTGARAFVLRALSVTAQKGQAAPERSGVGPLTPVFPIEMKPGQEVRLRRFVKLTQVGAYTCAFEAETAPGHTTVLNGPGGRPAFVTLTVVPAALAPQVSFTVSDPQSRHVFRSGQTVKIAITPFVSTGADLNGVVRSLTITPAAKPFSITDPAQSRALLLGGEGVRGNFSADFFGVPDSGKYLTIEIEFQVPSQVSTLRVSGFNPNGEYGLSGWEVTALQPDGSAIPLPAQKLQEGSAWTLLVGQRRSVTATGLRLRLHTHYKIQINGLTLQGRPATGKTQVNDAAISCRWTDAFGRPLTATRSLTAFQSNSVSSPSHLTPGYYGLVITTDIPAVDEARQEYGFVVLPPTPVEAKRVTDTRFGMVHMDLDDANPGVGWTKTLTAAFYNSEKQALDVAAWEDAIRYRQARGLNELPLVIGGEWDSDNTKPISPE